jgi:hypothetical protein
MGLEQQELLAALGIPKSRRLVVAGGQDALAIIRYFNTVDLCGVPFQL